MAYIKFFWIKRTMIWFLLAILILFFLASCEFTRKTILGTFLPPVYVDFPLGKNRIVEIDFLNYVEHKYYISMRIKFNKGNLKLFSRNKEGDRRINEKINNFQRAFIGLTSADHREFYRFKVFGYKINKKGKPILFFQKEYSNKSRVYEVYGSNVNNPDDLAFSTNYDYLTLPRGKYHFVIEDKSLYTPMFGDIEAFIGIHVDTLIH